jgi:hypothetical protein
MAVHTCNPSTWETKAGRSGVAGQPELFSSLIQPNKNKTKEEEEKSSP